ncbi:hypothetical protein LPTSP4_32870 [Leptospira ryugenii]|uniref:DUF3291 domain-containing protein n=1 Tax=Leptospira ryugenii TaxID=1917863 RepID=A0A2P2E4D9_9LEPT|nr:antibiotic biosynthesis monooxygenase [Leptospira ryugenii]GBF51749.1 hypothetical protein LPTSP4_32870 [Leptospira ryugenii]
MKEFSFLLVALTSWISNCAFASPFQKSAQINQFNLQPDSEVLIALTEVDIAGTNADRSTFWDRVSSVRNDLKNRPGFLGASIRKEVFGSRAWTMTVWTNEEALEDFVYAKEHERAMKEGAPAVRKGTFYRGKKKWKEIPIAWEEAERLLSEEGRTE